MSSVLLVFVDGLGLGPCDPASNPLARFQPTTLNCYKNRLGPFPRDGVCLPTDVSLGVPGVPQSATGQTSLFTGVNAAQAVGRHNPGFPNGELRDLIARRSFVRRLKEDGYSAAFLNTYTPPFLENRPRWVSVTTVVCETAGLRLNDLDDLRAGRSLYMDFTNRLLVDLGYQVSLRTPEEAAQVLIGQADRYDFAFYEYFLTDVVGHQGSIEESQEVLSKLDRFLTEAVRGLNLEQHSLVVTSDHGNVEDSSAPPHTLNPVPTLLWGPIRNLARDRSQLEITDIAPLIERCVRAKPDIQRDARNGG
jgi:2,3-bisphosphoglycerate-independent phosphoglycerate mutase